MKTKIVNKENRYIVKVKIHFLGKWYSVGDVKTGKVKTYIIKQQAESVAKAIQEGRILWQKVAE